MQQVVGDADVKKVKLRCLYQLALHGFGVRRHKISEQRVHKQLKVGFHSHGTNAAVGGDVGIHQHFAARQSRRLKKPIERRQIAHHSLLRDFGLQVQPDITAQPPCRILDKVMARNHPVVDSAVDVELVAQLVASPNSSLTSG